MEFAQIKIKFLKEKKHMDEISHSKLKLKLYDN